jgi:hypothetical protein
VNQTILQVLYYNDQLPKGAMKNVQIQHQSNRFCTNIITIMDEPVQIAWA